MSEFGEGVVNVSISVDQSEIDSALAAIDAGGSGKGVSTGTGRVRQPKFVSKYAQLPDESWADKDMLRMINRMQEQTEDIGFEIKGIETTVHRVARMIPGIREVDSIYKNIGRMQAGNVLLAGLNFVLIAKRVIDMINRYFEQKKRQEQELEATVREIRNITTHEGYTQWSANQRTSMNSARTRNITM